MSETESEQQSAENDVPGLIEDAVRMERESGRSRPGVRDVPRLSDADNDAATRVVFDTEFIEDGRTIDLISIGLVRDDGATYYAVTRDMPVRRIRKHAWLMENVVPSLPQGHGDWRNHMPKRWLFDYHDPCVKPRAQIAREIIAFVGPRPEFWAWYADYDWVALCQLYGTMMDLPDGWPMFCRDYRQVTDGSSLPKQDPSLDGPEHHALSDARWLARVIPPEAQRRP